MPSVRSSTLAARHSSVVRHNPNTSPSSQSSPHRLPRSSDEDIEPSFYGLIETVEDALLVVYLYLLGKVQPISKRLPPSQRSRLISSGNVFLFCEDETTIKRWTDGKKWSPSRVWGPFLVYREPKSAPSPSSSVDNLSSDDDLSFMTDLRIKDINLMRRVDDKNRIRRLVVSLTDNSRTNKGFVNPDGLVKRTITLHGANGARYHLICYYTLRDALAGTLPRPADEFGYLLDDIPSPLLDPANYRKDPPPAIFDAITGLWRYSANAIPQELQSSLSLPSPVSASSDHSYTWPPIPALIPTGPTFLNDGVDRSYQSYTSTPSSGMLSLPMPLHRMPMYPGEPLSSTSTSPTSSTFDVEEIERSLANAHRPHSGTVSHDSSYFGVPYNSYPRPIRTESYQSEATLVSEGDFIESPVDEYHASCASLPTFHFTAPESYPSFSATMPMQAPVPSRDCGFPRIIIPDTMPHTTTISPALLTPPSRPDIQSYFSAVEGEWQLA